MGNLGGALGNNFSGPGAKPDSFKRDGFNILGNEPIKKPTYDDSSAKEFADLFSMANTKIKDRGDNKPTMSFDYNPAAPAT